MNESRKELHSISQILHLTQHRNKNQHRLARWWKAFSMLRRHVAKLEKEIDITQRYTTLSARSKKTLEARENVERRAAFLEDVLIDKCYISFGNLMADNQYAPLGLMLLGTLASVRRIIVLLRGVTRANVTSEEASRREAYSSNGADTGVAVPRDQLLVNDDAESGQTQHEGSEVFALGLKRQSSPSILIKPLDAIDKRAITKKSHSKKRKKGDVFDDMFAELI